MIIKITLLAVFNAQFSYLYHHYSQVWGWHASTPGKGKKGDWWHNRSFTGAWLRETPGYFYLFIPKRLEESFASVKNAWKNLSLKILISNEEDLNKSLVCYSIKPNANEKEASIDESVTTMSSIQFAFLCFVNYISIISFYALPFILRCIKLFKPISLSYCPYLTFIHFFRPPAKM